MPTATTSVSLESDKTTSPTELFVLWNHLDDYVTLLIWNHKGEELGAFFQRAYRHHRCGWILVTPDNRESSDGFQRAWTTSTSAPCFTTRWSSIRRARKPTGVRLHFREQFSCVCKHKTALAEKAGKRNTIFRCTKRSASQTLSVPICVNSLADTLNVVSQR